MNLSTLPLSPSEANSHQAGAAYRRVAIVVARVTSSSCPGGRPWERRVLRATIEAAHLTRVRRRTRLYDSIPALEVENHECCARIKIGVYIITLCLRKIVIDTD